MAAAASASLVMMTAALLFVFRMVAAASMSTVSFLVVAAAVFAVSVMPFVVGAVGFIAINEFSGGISFCRFIGRTCHPGAQLNAYFCECSLSAAADTAADQNIDIAS